MSNQAHGLQAKLLQAAKMKAGNRRYTEGTGSLGVPPFISFQDFANKLTGNLTAMNEAALFTPNIHILDKWIHIALSHGVGLPQAPNEKEEDGDASQRAVNNQEGKERKKRREHKVVYDIRVYQIRH